MAIAVTQVGRRTVFGDRRVGFYDVVFSGNYAAGGEAVTPATWGLSDVDYISNELGVATAGTTAVAVSFNPGTSKLQSWESAATGLPFLEKTDTEVYITGQTARLMVVGH